MSFYDRISESEPPYGEGDRVYSATEPVGEGTVVGLTDDPRTPWRGTTRTSSAAPTPLTSFATPRTRRE